MIEKLLQKIESESDERKFVLVEFEIYKNKIKGVILGIKTHQNLTELRSPDMSF